MFVKGVAWTSLQWGAWSGVGMAAVSSALLGRLQRQVSAQSSSILRVGG